MTPSQQKELELLFLEGFESIIEYNKYVAYWSALWSIENSSNPSNVLLLNLHNMDEQELLEVAEQERINYLSPVTRGTYSQTDYLKHCQHHGFTTFNPNY